MCQVANSWVEVGSFHTRLLGVVYFAIASARTFLDTPSYRTSLFHQFPKYYSVINLKRRTMLGTFIKPCCTLPSSESFNLTLRFWNHRLMFNNSNLCFCRSRLEYYEQSCAVDSVTKKCAGPPSECRKAMLGILGTELRSNCACKGTDFTQLYDCLGWQRLLWVNPCVGQYYYPVPHGNLVTYVIWTCFLA
jgi:hypothetical protein